jgi:hypothetical protein
MKRRLVQICLVIIIGLTGSVALAQRRGGGGQGGGKPPPPQTAEERDRAENAKKWADDIEKMRSEAPKQPLPNIHFPTENEKLLSRLRWAEDPKKELAQYLDKLWKDAKDAPARKGAIEGLWRDAEKPKWARAAIEGYYTKHADGAELHPAPEPADVSKAPAPAPAKPPANPPANP